MEQVSPSQTWSQSSKKEFIVWLGHNPRRQIFLLTWASSWMTDVGVTKINVAGWSESNLVTVLEDSFPGLTWSSSWIADLLVTKINPAG